MEIIGLDKYEKRVAKKLRALAKRALACDGWEWMPGMMVQSVAGVPHGRLRDGLIDTYADICMCLPCRLDSLPDLSDPTTLACLHYLVQEQHHRPVLVCLDAEDLVNALEGKR